MQNQEKIKNQLFKTIWKYVIGTIGEENNLTFIKMPPGADIVRVGMQGKLLCVWVCVIPINEEELITRTLFFTGTGFPVALKAKYLGSCTDGPFEWHVWEE